LRGKNAAFKPLSRKGFLLFLDGYVQREAEKYCTRKIMKFYVLGAGKEVFFFLRFATVFTKA